MMSLISRSSSGSSRMEVMCVSHSSSVVLYCSSCQQGLCEGCLTSGQHQQHRYLTLQQAVSTQLENMKNHVKKLSSKMKDCDDVEQQVTRAEQQLNEMFLRIRESISGQYQELQELLKHSQRQAFLLLEAEREAQSLHLSQLGEDGELFQQKTKALSVEVEQLRKRQKREDAASLLGETEALQTSLGALEDFYSSVNNKIKADTMRLKALEESVKKIVQKNKEILPRPWEFSEVITFDKNKMRKDLSISEEETLISLRSSSSRLRKISTPTRYNAFAAQSFSKGRHYWEVDVGKAETWAVGVAEQRSVEQQLGKDKVSWVLEREQDGDLVALHHHDVCRVKESSVQRLGVFLDVDEGRLRFYDVASGSVLHSFVTQFKKAVFPVFSLQTRPAATAQLRLCRLRRSKTQYNSDGSEDSGTYV